MTSINFRNKILILILAIIIFFTLIVIIAITNSFNWILEDIIFYYIFRLFLETTDESMFCILLPAKILDPSS
jgi:hypothetical protein